MRSGTQLTCFLILLCSLSVGYSQAKNESLARRSVRGFSYEFNEKLNRVIVTNVVKDSKAAKSGLKVNDTIISIDGVDLSGYTEAERSLSYLKSGKHNLVIKNTEAQKQIQVSFEPLPLEDYNLTNVDYGILRFDGYPLRTIVTKPKKAVSKKLPAVFLVPWLSCGSVEIPGDPADGFDYIIKSFANNPEVLFFRVERMGVGDSEGLPCATLDAKTEIAIYKRALQELLKREDVDKENVFVLGLSLGMSLAPIIAADYPIKGLMVSGGTTKSWYEHMLEFERNRIELSGSTSTETNSSMKLFSSFYHQYLIEKLSPKQIMNKDPNYKGIWYDVSEHQFGRNYKYFQQIQDLDFESAWSQIKFPSIIVHGEYDWVMSLEDHERAVSILNTSNKSNIAELRIVPGANHLLSTFSNKIDAFNEENGQVSTLGYELFWNWMKSQL